ncbi:MAG: hypothetical protein FXF47_00930 [Candidatus Mcinerneyibacterium aminivorans]|uniref:Rubrerythrin diiron-binding domain-containing protein n=1 Tax=Candidatus Mcinerneyibacterium aminivorans TaxID=2703815 RepID=A0A5D0MJF3_9BACT|nr:MAG: hypothetical protein FXF47_00930 [Candidatus Mcinerneyibacterium aminivorans]
MEKEKILKALKKGMKGEMDSINLYQQAADKAEEGDEVADFFLERVEEEKTHYNYLLKFYKAIKDDKNIKNISKDFPSVEEEKSPIISDEFYKRIGQKQYLFSAISTAALLELESIKHYEKWASLSKEKELKTFYKKLADWEREHYEEVLEIEKEAEKEYWIKNRFTPF